MKSDVNAVETPLMKQYNAVKRKHPDAILLFRVGDFYETFSEDAIKTSEILGITLTRRANGAASFVELAGFPHHALDTYLPRLVRAGQRVAICEQLEDPKMAKTIVKRGITELVTPGVSFNENVLEKKENNFLASVHMEKKQAGVAFLDISTGEFYAAEGTYEYIDKLLTNFNPKEVLVERSLYHEFTENFGTRFYVYKFEEWAYHEDGAREKLLAHFQVSSLKGFGIDSIRLGTIAAGAALYYLDLTQHHNVRHITSISRLDEDKYVWLDKFTIRNLELFHTVHEGAKTLVDTIDKTLSPMGARLLKKWIALPLKDTKPITERLNAVEFLISNGALMESMKERIREIGDLERVISKAAVGRISPREMISLKNALLALAPIKETCDSSADPTLRRIGEQINLCTLIRDRIAKEIVPDPPALLNKGNVIANGVNAELDELRGIMHSGKEYLIDLQQRESDRTGIPSLR
ncbi:MAG TPA: DNA mismatch repair protein MutS, partial [Tenuifilaceae bacterium]|nr:DNA mismatch repair protein MutS [Tenuifilaceae bacterium]